jgi:protease IV
MGQTYKYWRKPLPEIAASTTPISRKEIIMSSIPSSASEGFPSGERPVRVVLEQGGLLGRWGARIPWILCIIAIIFAVGYYNAYQSYLQRDPRVTEKFFSHSPDAKNKVAIITIDGAILHNDGFARWQIEHVRRDPDVKAVVVRVDSPGGTVTGSDYLYHHLKLLRDGDGTGRKLPLVVSMGAIAASGGYYVSMAAGDNPDTIFAERSTWTGSIGVIIPHYTIADLLQSWNIQDDSVVSGKFKAMGSPTRKISPQLAEEERQVLQTLVDQSFDQFKEIVREARPQLANNEKAWATATTGQVFTAKQALDLGLVDKLGYVEDAVDRAIELAKLDPRNVRVVNYTQPGGLLDSLLTVPSAQSSQINLSAVLEMTTPRAYFLCSWLPAVVANHSN